MAGAELWKLSETRSNKLSKEEANLSLRWRDDQAMVAMSKLKNLGGKVRKSGDLISIV